jgi:hypothetical protein
MPTSSTAIAFGGFVEALDGQDWTSTSVAAGASGGFVEGITGVGVDGSWALDGGGGAVGGVRAGSWLCPGAGSNIPQQHLRERSGWGSRDAGGWIPWV